MFVIFESQDVLNMCLILIDSMLRIILLYIMTLFCRLCNLSILNVRPSLKQQPKKQSNVCAGAVATVSGVRL